MNWSRIYAIVLQDIYHSKRAVEVWVDIFYFSAISVLAFGYLAVFFGQNGGMSEGYQILVGFMLWEVVRVTQYCITIGAMFNIWSRNLSNLFTTPLTVPEFMAAFALSSILKVAIVFTMLSVICASIFHFNILSLGILNIILHIFNLMLFAYATGVFLLGLIFRFGTRIQSLAWGLIFIFQPLSAAFYPLSLLPSFFQKLALLFPATYVFEAARGNVSNPATNWDYVVKAFGLNIVFTIVFFGFFRFMYRRSRETGQFARNEG